MTDSQTQRSKNLDEKLTHLKKILHGMGSVLIAFSGGADSSLLYKVASDMLGDKVLGVTGRSPSVPEQDQADTLNFVQQYHLNHLFIDTKEIENEEFLKNPVNRCFLCKDELFSQLHRLRKEKGLEWIIDGTNADDLSDYRPGILAARKHEIRSPLQEADFTKENIRTLSKAMGLPTWNKPSSPCLASRFPYGIRISIPALRQVDRCENFLKNKGLSPVRVRHDDKVARIEVPPKDFESVIKNHYEITSFFKKEGYTYITLDLEGFRSGSLNESLENQSSQEVSHAPNHSNTKKEKKKRTFVPKTFGEDIYTLYTDGGCKQNPGPGAWGYVLFDSAGKEVHRNAEMMGHTTNNIAEYQAMIQGMTYALHIKVSKIHILSDSQLMVRQINGQYRIKNPRLQELVLEALKLRHRFKDWKISDIDREKNWLADQIVYNCLRPKKKPPGNAPENMV